VELSHAQNAALLKLLRHQQLPGDPAFRVPSGPGRVLAARGLILPGPDPEQPYANPSLTEAGLRHVKELLERHRSRIGLPPE